MAVTKQANKLWRRASPVSADLLYGSKQWCGIELCRFANCETKGLRATKGHGDMTTIIANYTYMYLYCDKTTCAKVVRRFVKRNCALNGAL